MIKKILFAFFMLGIRYTSFSQSIINKYCEIEAYHKSGFTSVFTIRFVPGNIDSLFSFKDSSVVVGLKKVNGLSSITDALNLLAEQGWNFIAVTTTASVGPIKFFFKKEFDRKELN
ncbi:MAG TPA: hypothetical protein VK772_16335 [Puia sp.]|nr:hypothetical protein [Puia sp.]